MPLSKPLSLSSSDDIKYKDWIIEFYPIPLQVDFEKGLTHCYMATHKDFDGPEDNRCFTAGSPEECIQIIKSEYENE